jgi:acyl dehydratase
MMRISDITAGSEPPPRVLGPVTVTDFVRYQGASGDMNPIHHDQRFAEKSGLEAPMGVGMYHAGVMTTWATDWLGPANLRSVRLRWKAPVWPGDTLSTSGVVARTYEEAGTHKVDLELTCSKVDGGVVALGWMTFELPG